MIRLARAGVLPALVALLAVVVAAGPSAAPFEQTPAPRTGTGVIVGQVVDGASGSGLASAIVSLAAAAPVNPDGTGGPGTPPPARGAQPPRVMADASGRFVFHSITAGAYTLTATRSGYAAAAGIQTAPGTVSRRLELADGQRILNAKITMWKEPRISGTLFDESGEPAAGARLKLILREGSAAAPRYRERNSVATDNRGRYEFGYLVPGDYLVAVQLLVASVSLETAASYADAMATGPSSANKVGTDVAASGGFIGTGGMRLGDQLIQRSTNLSQGGMVGPVVVRPDGKTLAYPTTFYPGVPTIAAATVLTLKAGEERTGINFTMKPVPAVRVSGTVTGPDGPVPNTTVMIAAAGVEATIGTPSLGAEIAQAVTNRNGQFVAPAVPAGEYSVSVLKIPVGTDSVLSGRRSIRVADANVDGIVIQVATGATVSGRIEFEPGIAAPPMEELQRRVRVVLTPVAGSSGERLIAVAIERDGSFRTRGHQPGQYQVNITPITGWTLKSVTFGGRDLLDAPLDLAGGDVSGVIATLTDKAGEIAGRVNAGPTDGLSMVMLWPVDARGQAVVNRQRMTIVNDDATYRFTDVLPGEYFLIAVPEGSVAVQDTQAMIALARRGTRVAVGDREKRSQPLTLARGR